MTVADERKPTTGPLRLEPAAEADPAEAASPITDCGLGGVGDE
jgi:hypothetical protein